MKTTKDLLHLPPDEPCPEASLISGPEAMQYLPQLFFAADAFRQLSCYYRSIQSEFQLMGFVEHNPEESIFRVTELAINAQHAGIAHAHNDVREFADFLQKLELQGKDVGKLRLQAHSHGRIEAYFSQTDVGTIRDSYACDWMISMVGNLELHLLARLDIFEPVPLSISLPIFVEPDTSVLSPHDVKIEEVAWLQELHAHMQFGEDRKVYRG